MMTVEEERILHPSYAGLNRTAMIGGVPMFAALIIACTSLISSLIGGFALGPGGLLIGSAGVPVFMFFRSVCLTDDRALHLMWLEFCCWINRRRVSVFGKTYTLAPMRYGRDLDLYTRSFSGGRDLVRFEILRQSLLSPNLENIDE
ncbi:VirB3 family type IV secretion system protein [Robbsia andropogonis]|uniref:VirB3 family type IV secretion system protein n=2 Tax=Robbsia andropogonis TaxID=28092 RepID=UPI001FC7F6B1|nr:VirB3 family type IV secretion system protein [Robbsia andropogonis]MCP1121319.1 VirB3 family type IV secretion system protein [Robbsia andropogonis]MCP1131105.1 VirB3 family type IV secretion system protein [Robbsia andropogonis]